MIMIMYTLCIYILSMERHFISDYIFYFGRPLKNIPNFYKIRNCFGNRLGLEIPQKTHDDQLMIGIYYIGTGTDWYHYAS